ncbi:hypothetical protein DFH09DRAFT_1305482 [Mycena vulgaris]|nr:hypothetical protein DFH09DRAFT_1305482 [Mycena vulgaris]
MSTGTISLQAALGYIDDIEETLQNTTSNSPGTTLLKGQVRHRLTRVLSRLPPAPAATASRRRPDRGSLEPPCPAQPTPRSPPKTKPTKKEAKTLRCRKYAREILATSLQDDLLTADDFFSNLMKPFRGNSAEQETFAMSKLARGYVTGTPDSWRAARGAVDFASLSLQVYLKQEQEYAKIDDLTQRLLLRHHNLGRQETTSDISNFLRVLFQTVNAIEFSVEVKKLGAGSGGTKHKTALYQSMYDAEGVSDSYAAWKTKNEAQVTARNRLADVYFAFGPIMLFDSFWSPRNMEPNHRSTDFGENLTELINAIPIEPQTGVSPLSRYLTSTQNALATFLELIYPSAANHVMKFCRTHPPSIVMDSDSSDDSD